MQLFIVSVTDEALGRLEYDSLTDQARMEVLIEGLREESKAHFQDAHGSYLDVCDWQIVDCAADNAILEVSSRLLLKGSLNLDFLPPLVTKICMHSGKTTGTIQTKLLPEGLTTFSMSMHPFVGTVDFTTCPGNLELMRLSHSKCAGSCDLTNLPRVLRILNLNHNEFSGAISLCKLPPNLKQLELTSNQFSGTLQFDSLPPSLSLLFLYRNKFSGSFKLCNPSRSLGCVSAWSNCFSGTAVVERDIQRLSILLGTNDIRTVVDEAGVEHPKKREILDEDADSWGGISPDGPWDLM